MSNGTGIAEIIFTPNEKEVAEDSDNIQLNYNTYPLYVGNSKDFKAWEDKGDTVTLEARVLSTDYESSDIIWSVTDDSILEIKSQNSGTAQIQAVRTGMAEAIASLPDGSKRRCYISVIDNYTRLTTQRIEFNIDELNLKIGESSTVLPIIYPKDLYNNGMLDNTLEWSSSDTGVATVENGIINAVGNGTATITAISADVGRTASMTVTVSEDTEGEEISISGNENMTVGETQQLMAECGGEVVWKSDNSYIADVDNNGLVTAYSKSAKQTLADNGINMQDTPDTVKIYATAKDGGSTAEFDIQVLDAPSEVQAVEIDKDKINIVKGSKRNITASILPASIVDAEITWSSSDDSIVSVAETSRTIDGVNQADMEAKNAGTAVITAEYGGKTDTCEVTVTDGEVKVQDIIISETAEIDIDEVYKLNAEITADASNQDIIWLSENDDIATVDIDGTLMGYSAGEVKIYAIAADSLTESEIKEIKTKKKNGIRQFGSEELSNYLKIYDVCELTVKDRSPYLRNVHIEEESVTHNSVNILWNRASMTEAADFDKYRVYVDGILEAEINTLGYTINNLSSDTEYTFKIEAIDNSGDVAAEESVTAKTKAEPEVINVLDYGAVGNGKVTETYAIQKAINECPENGIVLIPKGYTFYCGALFLKSNMTLQVDGTLLGSTDPKDYPEIVSRWEGWRKLPQTALEWANTQSGGYLEENEYANASLINIGTHNEGEAGKIGAYNAHNIVICGEGQINGNGYVLAYNEGPNHIQDGKGYYKAESPATDPTTRGRTISMYNAENIYVKDVLVSYSPAWTNHVVYSNNVTYDNVKVISAGSGVIGGESGGHLYNGDGIDPDSTRNMNIFNSFLKTGDDAVTLKSGRNREGNELNKPNAYIRVTDCLAKDSLGGFGSGSETSAGSHDILFQNLSIENVDMNGIWFKTNKARGGITENVSLRDIVTNKARSCVHVMHNYVSSQNNAAEETPKFRNVIFDNVSGSELDYGLQFAGISQSHINDIKVINPHFETRTYCSASYCNNFEIWDEENTFWENDNSTNINFIYNSVLNDTALEAVENAIRVRKIDNDNKIISVILGTTKEDLLKELKSKLGGVQTYYLSSNVIDKECKLTVTSQNGEYSDVYSIDIIENIISPDLRGLSIITENGKELIKHFGMNKTKYSADVSKDVLAVSVTAVADDVNAEYVMKVNGTEFEGNAELITGDNVITIDVTSSDGIKQKQYTVNINNSYFIAEDFSNVSDDTWGFAGTNGASVKTASIANADALETETLKLLTSNKSNTYVEKTFDNEISSLKKAHIKFDWQSNTVAGNGRNSYFTLRDTSGNPIFGMYSYGKDNICCFTTSYETNTILEGFSNAWYTVDLYIDFEYKLFGGTVTNKNTGRIVKTFKDEPITTGAQNLGSMYAYDLWSAATMSIDNVFISEETMPEETVDPIVWDFEYLYDQIKDNPEQLELLTPTSTQLAAYYTAGADNITKADPNNKYLPSETRTTKIKLSNDAAIDEKGLYLGSSGSGQNVSLDIYSGTNGGTVYLLTEKGNTARGGKRSGENGGAVGKTESVDENYDIVSYTIPANSVYYVGIEQDNGHIIKAEFIPAAEATPNIRIDYTSEKLTGFDTLAKYTIDVNGDTVNEVKPNNDGEIKINDLWFGEIISIVRKGNGETTSDSKPQMIEVKERPLSPNITASAVTSVGAHDGKLIGTTTAMEYRMLGSEKWNDCTDRETSNLLSGTYEVRLKSTDTSFSGEASTVVVDTECVKITATYEDGALKTVEIGKGLVSEAKAIDESASTKIFYWESLESMKPIGIQ